MPYLNARPLVAGLAEAAGVSYTEEVPSRLAVMLGKGEVDVALVSSIEAVRIGMDRIVDELCIASDGPVWSVQLFGAGDPSAAREVALDGASLTAATLARIYYQRLLGRHDVRFRTVEPAPAPERTGADATLVIGDAALRLHEAGAVAGLDLGAAWSRATGLPFVWAVWLLADGVDPRPLHDRLLAAHAAGMQQHAEHARTAATELGISEATAFGYLSRIMRYRLGKRERASLERFAELSREVL